MLETVHKNVLTLRSNHCSKDFLQRLSRLRDDNFFVDISLKVEDTLIPAHRVVLCASSTYFDRMLTTDFKEKESGTIELSGGLEPASVRRVIDFFYSGILHADPTNICSLLAVVDLFLLDQTKASLIRYLQQIISSDNCVTIKHLGDLYSDLELSKSADRFLRRNFEDVMDTEGFLELTRDELGTILEGGGALFVKAEDRILEAVVRWLSKHPEATDKDTNELFEKIQLTEISVDTIDKLLTDNKFKQTVMELRERDARGDLDPEVEGNVRRRKRARGLNKFIVACSFDSKVIEYLDLDHVEQGWTILTEIPGMRYGLSGAAMVTHRDNILITGGVGKGGVLKAVERFLIFNVRSNSWTEGPPMTHARKCHASGITPDGKLYVTGGTDTQTPVLETEYLDLSQPPASWSWSSAAPLQVWHNGSQMIDLGDGTNSKFAVLASYGEENDKIYDYQTDLWLSLPLRPRPSPPDATPSSARAARDHPGFSRLGVCSLLAVGGCSGREHLATVEVYSLEEEIWKAWPDLNVPREGPGVVEIGDVIYVVGGKGSKGTVEIFDNRTEEWKLSRDLKMKNENEEYVACILERIV